MQVSPFRFGLSRLLNGGIGAGWWRFSWFSVPFCGCVWLAVLLWFAIGLTLLRVAMSRFSLRMAVLLRLGYGSAWSCSAYVRRVAGMSGWCSSVAQLSLCFSVRPDACTFDFRGSGSPIVSFGVCCLFAPAPIFFARHFRSCPYLFHLSVSCSIWQMRRCCWFLLYIQAGGGRGFAMHAARRYNFVHSWQLYTFTVTIVAAVRLHILKLYTYRNLFMLT